MAGWKMFLTEAKKYQIISHLGVAKRTEETGAWNILSQMKLKVDFWKAEG